MTNLEIASAEGRLGVLTVGLGAVASTLMAGVELPSKAIREQISSAVDLIVHIQRFPDGSRKITHLTEVGRLEGDIITTSDIYKHMNDNGAVVANG